MPADKDLSLSHETPRDLLELYEVLEWQRALDETAIERADNG